MLAGVEDQSPICGNFPVYAGHILWFIEADNVLRGISHTFLQSFQISRGRSGGTLMDPAIGGA